MKQFVVAPLPMPAKLTPLYLDRLPYPDLCLLVRGSPDLLFLYHSLVECTPTKYSSAND